MFNNDELGRVWKAAGMDICLERQHVKMACLWAEIRTPDYVAGVLTAWPRLSLIDKQTGR
jgi:hypothetical protein